MNLKAIATSVIALLTTTLGVQAADNASPAYKTPPKSVYDYSWTGFYLGANAGFGSVNNSNAGGFIWGGTLGYNQQIGNFVVGLEGDYDWSNIQATTFVGVCATSATGCRINNNWIATVRGRIGYAFDRYLAYATGGLAYGNAKVTADSGFDVANRSGYAIGAGLEYRIDVHWTARAEYLYVNLSDHNCAFCSPDVPIIADFRQNIVRLGLNYKFDGPMLFNSSRY
jgi:outer membrane immunogenic protein